MAKEDRAAYDGLANLAHSIRRSTALYVAMTITPPESSIEIMLANADRMAAWLAGKAGQREQEIAEEPEAGPLGVPFGQRDAYEG